MAEHDQSEEHIEERSDQPLPNAACPAITALTDHSNPDEKTTIKSTSLRLGPEEETPAASLLVPQPLVVQVVEEIHPNAFEKKTVLIGWLSVISGLMSLLAAVVAGFLVYQQWSEMNTQTGLMSQSALQARRDSASASLATSEQLATLGEQLKTAREAVQIENRPWIKIKHQIVSPLNFDAVSGSGQIASITIRDTLENVGTSVALNVGHWEELIPMDPTILHSERTAIRRAKYYCDRHRHPDPGELQGESLFPHDPSVETSMIGLGMDRVRRSALREPNSSVDGKVGFVVVGCVWYRSSFEPRSNPSHQTRFMYYLGLPDSEGGFQPYVLPTGIAQGLQLIDIPNGYTVD